MDTPKISVVIPVYNGEKYLDNCLQSLIAQTFFANMELLLINDGSTDGSGAMMEEYVKKYPQIRAFHIPNGGVSNARNLGILHARGEYIAFVDADDWVESDCYESMYACSNNGKADIVAAGLMIDEGDRVLLTIVPADTEHVLTGKETVRLFLRGDLDVHVFNKLFKRTIATEVSFHSELRIGEDKLYLAQCLMQAERVCLMDRSFYHYYQNKDSVMHQAFSEKHLDDIPVGQRIIELTEQTYPELNAYAQCMNINAMCRILGDISLSAETKKTYCKQYAALRQQVRKFDILQSIRHSSKKHWISLLVAKISPMLYGRLRRNQRLKYTKI